MWQLTLHRWVGDRSEALTMLDEHLTGMRNQQRAGNIIAAGPSSDGELGIMVLRHMSRDEVDSFLSTEPFTQASRRTYEVIPWEPHHVLGVGGFDTQTVTAIAAAEHAD